MTTLNTLTFTGTTTTVETTQNEFVAFAMDKANKITVPFIKSELNRLGHSFSKSLVKEELAKLWFTALENEASADETTSCNRCYAVVEEVKWGLCAPCLTEVEEIELKEMQSAIGETPVAETKLEEEVVMKELDTPAVLQEITKRKNMKALEDSKYLARTASRILQTTDHKYVNTATVELHGKIDEAVARFYDTLGEFAVEILRVVPLTNDIWGRLGYVDIIIPEGYAQVKIWNDVEKANEWYDFSGFNYNQMVTRQKWSGAYSPAGMVRNLEIGSGILRLGIRESKDGQAYVNMPVDKDDKKEGVFYDIFTTADIRYGRHNSSNNALLTSRVTAMLRFFWQELKLENPMNRNDFNASCVTCANSQWFGARNGVDDDMEISDRKSTRLLNQLDTTALAQHGAHMKQLYCTVKKKFVDEDAVEIANKLLQDERREYQVEILDPITGQTRLEYRFQGHDEVLLAGKPVKVRDIRIETTREVASNCLSFRKNEFKGENAIGGEIVKAREKLLEGKTAAEQTAIKETKAYKKPYIQRYWTTRPTAGREGFETLIKVDGQAAWVPGFPAEVAKEGEEVLDIRVSGQAGLNVYFSKALRNVLTQEDLRFRPGMEAYREDEAKFNKLINMVFHAAFHRKEITAEQFEYVSEVVLDGIDTDGLTEKQIKRWDNATYWFEQSLQWSIQNIEAKNRPAFMTKFFATPEDYKAVKAVNDVPSTVREIHVEDVISETLFKVSEGGFGGEWYDGMFNALGLEKGYEDLSPEEFVRFMDEEARDYVIDALLSGDEFILISGQKESIYTEEDLYNRAVHGVEDDAPLDLTKEVQLAAGALQILLGREVNGLLYGINTSSEKVEAFLELEVSEDVLEYIAVHAGIISK